MKFKVGDRVKNKIGDFGIIKGMDTDDKTYAVEYDKSFAGGHDCDGLCRDKHGWWASEGSIELVKFTKANLQDGDVVTLRNGDRLLFIDSEFWEFAESDTDNELCARRDLNNDLTFDGTGRKNDIVKVERPTTYETLFQRIEGKKEMTIAEIEKALGYEVKIIKEEK